MADFDDFDDGFGSDFGSSGFGTTSDAPPPASSLAQPPAADGEPAGGGDAEAGGDDLTDEDIVQRLREMGPCPMGFAWHREGSGWRCGGGSHFVHDDDPMLQA